VEKATPKKGKKKGDSGKSLLSGVRDLAAGGGGQLCRTEIKDSSRKGKKEEIENFMQRKAVRKLGGRRERLRGVREEMKRRKKTSRNERKEVFNGKKEEKNKR